MSATALNMTPQALVAELKTGKSIAQVATEHSVSTQTVSNALVSDFNAKIQAAVSGGKITAAHGQAFKARCRPSSLAS